MKIFLSIFSILLLSGVARSQDNSDTVSLKNIKLDLLKTPSNPSFLLMNTSPTEIIEPGSAPEFFTSVLNSSNNLSSFPNNYGIAVTPFWWGKNAKTLSFDSDFDTVNRVNFYRTLSISGGMVQGIEGNQQLSRYSLGFQSTLLRGKVDPKKKRIYFDRLQSQLRNHISRLEDAYQTDPQYVKVEEEMAVVMDSIVMVRSNLSQGILTREEAIPQLNVLVEKNRALAKKLDSIKTTLSNEIPPMESTEDINHLFNDLNTRIGFKWDIGGGMALNSENSRLDNTGLYRMGLWSNFGGDLFNDKNNSNVLSVFALSRFLHFKEIIYERESGIEMINNLNTFDFGLKLQLNLRNRFMLGIEAIHRSALAEDIFENTYKINGIAQYQLGSNRLMYASFGNQFNDSSNSGPQILMVTFGVNLGFGSNFDLKNLRL